MLLLFLEAASSSERSEFRWDILHRVVWVEEESARRSWGGKRRPESCWLDLIKASGICYLSAKIMTQVGPHWLSLRADIFVLLLTGTLVHCAMMQEIGIVRRLSTSTETKAVVLKCRRPSTSRAGRSVFVYDIKLSVDHGQSALSPLTQSQPSRQLPTPSASSPFGSSGPCSTEMVNRF